MRGSDAARLGPSRAREQITVLAALLGFVGGDPRSCALGPRRRWRHQGLRALIERSLWLASSRDGRAGRADPAPLCVPCRMEVAVARPAGCRGGLVQPGCLVVGEGSLADARA